MEISKPKELIVYKDEYLKNVYDMTNGLITRYRYLFSVDDPIMVSLGNLDTILSIITTTLPDIEITESSLTFDEQGVPDIKFSIHTSKYILNTHD